MMGSRSESEITRRIDEMQKALGPVLWQLHVPSTDCKTYATALGLISRMLQKRARYMMIKPALISWIAAFIITLCVITLSKAEGNDPLFVYFIIFMTIAFILQNIHQKAIHRVLYEAHGNQPCDVMLGEGGILVASASWFKFFLWSDIVTFSRCQYGLYLPTEGFAIIILPEAVLSQNSDAEAMMAFIEQKLSGAQKG